MLARTADNLFWLARYMERADFIARTVEATLRLEYLPRGGVDDAHSEWLSALEAAGITINTKTIALAERRNWVSPRAMRGADVITNAVSPRDLSPCQRRTHGIGDIGGVGVAAQVGSHHTSPCGRFDGGH